MRAQSVSAAVGATAWAFGQRGLQCVRSPANTLALQGCWLGTGHCTAGCGARPSATPRRRPTAADTDWARIVLLYDGLRQVAPSPVVRAESGGRRGDG